MISNIITSIYKLDWVFELWRSLCASYLLLFDNIIAKSLLPTWGFLRFWYSSYILYLLSIVYILYMFCSLGHRGLLL